MTTKSDALPRRVILGCALAALLVSGSNVPGQESGGVTKKPVVLVPPFENQSKHHQNINYEVATGSNPDQPKRRFIIDRLTESPRSVLENMLGNIEGITIVERQRVDALLVEAEFGGLSGLVDPEKAVKLGKMLGANLIVMGTIIDLHDEVVTFQGYGIRTENTKVICQIRMRLLDIETGKVQFSKIIKGSQTYSKPASAVHRVPTGISRPSRPRSSNSRETDSRPPFWDESPARPRQPPPMGWWKSSSRPSPRIATSRSTASTSAARH